MRFSSSLMRSGVAAVAIMAAGAAWAACTVSPASFDKKQAPSGAHLQSGTPSCAVDLATQTVSCTPYAIGGVGNVNATENLIVVFQNTSASARGEVRNGQLRVGALSAGPPSGGPTIASFTYTLTFDGFSKPFITITGACS